MANKKTDTYYGAYYGVDHEIYVRHQDICDGDWILLDNAQFAQKISSPKGTLTFPLMQKTGDALSSFLGDSLKPIRNVVIAVDRPVDDFNFMEEREFTANVYLYSRFDKTTDPNVEPYIRCELKIVASGRKMVPVASRERKNVVPRNTSIWDYYKQKIIL